MAFCGSCGTQVQDGVGFCPSCGKQMGAAPAQAAQPAQPQQPVYQQPVQPQQQVYQQPVQPGIPLTEEAKDIQDNKVMGILSYFGPLVLVPWFAAPNSKFARFHAKQGMKLLIFWAANVILNIIFSFIRIRHTSYVLGIPYQTTSTPWFLGLITWLISIAISVLAILGLVNAIQGKFKELPVLDKIPLFK